MALPKHANIALIDHGEPSDARCEAFCLSLLLQDKANAVEVAATLEEPAPLALLPGKRFTLAAMSRQCLVGMRDYNFLTGQTSQERHDDFVRHGFVPVEYDKCLASESVRVDPVQQVTLVEWHGADAPSAEPKIGYSGAVSLIRTVIPVKGRPPLIQEAKYRAGWRYSEPLMIWPYAGDAGSGTYFSPSISISYFREPGFPEPSLPRFWRLLKGSEAWGQSAAAWLDTVVARGRRR